MHSRMRHRVGEFQRVLNRAKTEVATTEKKTIRLVIITSFLKLSMVKFSYSLIPYSGRTLVSR